MTGTEADRMLLLSVLIRYGDVRQVLRRAGCEPRRLAATIAKQMGSAPVLPDRLPPFLDPSGDMPDYPRIAPSRQPGRGVSP